jgi:hypothetical protein
MHFLIIMVTDDSGKQRVWVKGKASSSPSSAYTLGYFVAHPLDFNIHLV